MRPSPASNARRPRLRPAAAGSPEAPLIARSAPDHASGSPELRPASAKSAAWAALADHRPWFRHGPSPSSSHSPHSSWQESPSVIANALAPMCGRRSEVPQLPYSYTPQRLLLSSHRRHAPVYGKWRGFRRSTSSECWRSSRARSSRQCRACGSAAPPSAPSPASLAARGAIAGDSSASASAPATSASSP